MAYSVGIRGAGLAGMSLAQALLALDPSLTISLFDVRDRLPHPARTFCFFDDGKSVAPSVPRYSWQRVALRGNGFSREISVADAPYTMVRGDDYFATTLQCLEDAGVSFRWGCRSVEVATKSSLVVDEHKRVFDTVIDAAFRVEDAHSLLWQSFAGEWITAERDIFDPGCAVLMDLGESSAESPVSFVYILPTSARDALVEHTTFSVRPMAREAHLALCDRWIQTNVGCSVSRGPREYGCIPMGLKGGAKSGKLSVGSTSGAVRPATGYAFQTIQHQAVVIAERIVNRAGGTVEPFPVWLRFGDRLFLRALERSPFRGTALMESLLSRAPSKELVAFLAGKATLREALRVWSSVSKVSMIRALVGL